MADHMLKTMSCNSFNPLHPLGSMYNYCFHFIDAKTGRNFSGDYNYLFTWWPFP